MHTVTYTPGITPTDFAFGTTFSGIKVGLWNLGADPAGSPAYDPVVVSAAPYIAAIPGVADGSYTLIAQAMDNSTPPVPLGAPYSVNIVVTDPPVSIPLPTGGTVTIS